MLKGKFHPITFHEGTQGEQSISSTLSLTSAVDGGGWSTPRHCRSNPGNEPVPSVQEATWAPAPVWTDAENLAPTWIPFPDRLAHSESLY
jgi:hypothetical protein